MGKEWVQREDATEIVWARHKGLNLKEALGKTGINLHATKKADLAELGVWLDMKYETGLRGNSQVVI